jgi:hypothetical protein
MISGHSWTPISSSTRNRPFFSFIDEDRTASFPVGQTTCTETGLEWQKSQTFSIGFAYELAWVGDRSVDQYRGPPSAGCSAS